MIYSRKTMNWMELVGAVGGFVAFINKFAAVVFGWLTKYQYSAFVANRLYTWHEPMNITKTFRPHLFKTEDEEGN